MPSAAIAGRIMPASSKCSSASRRWTIRPPPRWSSCSANFPSIPIRLIECPERLGANGKVSTLVQLAAHARYDFLLINDSDIPLRRAISSA